METTKTVIGSGFGAAFVGLALALSAAQAKATEPTNATDYSIAAHWMLIPAVTNKAVDIFYIYPTAWTSTNNDVPEICAIAEPSMLVQAPQASAKQVTAFEPIGNIYAPFYRQDNLSPIDRLEIIAGIPTTDVTAAFDYYIQNYNHGRPFILAGHSQGSDVLSNLLAGYLKDHPVIRDRMIVAYVIGFPITAQYLADNPHLKFAEGPGDTGVIISYNTQAPGVPPGVNPVLSGLIGVVINPLTWTRDTTLATTNQGFGSFMPNSNGVYARVPQYADAQVNITNGVLICSTADTNALGKISGLAAYGVFHNFDYPFYYFNLRSNAVNRTQNFLHKVGTDYDADGKADPVIYTAGGGELTVFMSAANYAAVSVLMDLPSALNLQPVPGDFDGDGKADPAIYDPITCQWLVRFSSQAYNLFSLPIGDSTCVPAGGDFDGDAKADPALYSAVSGLFAAWMSGSGYAPVSIPLGGEDWVSASADYDGDAKADPAVYRTQTGEWLILQSSQNYTLATLVTPAAADVVPAMGDYDGDGKADPAVFQPATGLWLIAFSSQNYAQTLFPGFASSTFLARPGDYDNDGKTDPAVYDPGLSAYCVWMSASGYTPAILSW